jgi:hypothetical protein
MHYATPLKAREVGLYEKQSSFFIQAKTAQSIIQGNVFFNGPRVRCSSLPASQCSLATNAWDTMASCTVFVSLWQPTFLSNQRMGHSGLLVRCAFWTQIYTRGCHWFPRLLASSDHACDQWHSYRVLTHRTGLHCKFRPNTEGRNQCKRWLWRWGRHWIQSGVFHLPREWRPWPL